MTVVINGTTGITNPNSMTVGNGGGNIATNTAVGTSALAANTTGSRSVAVGDFALAANTTGYRNVALGSEALLVNTTGFYNTGLGWRALGSTSTGQENTGSGYYALYNNTTGSYNTAHGGGALQSNTTSSRNTAVGYQAGYSNNTTGANTYLGYQSGYTANGAANGLTFVGDSSGYSATTGTFNTFVGQSSGYAVTSGGKNTIIGCYTGNQGGLDIRTASNYIVLSDGDGNPRGIFETANFLVGSTTNALTGGIMIIPNNGNSLVRVGHVSGTASTSYYHQFYYDSNLIGSIQQSGTTAVTYLTSSDYRLKEDVQPMRNALAKVAALKPCTYKWKSDGSDGEGFLAHELAEVVPLCVSGEKDEVDEDGNPKYQGIDTSFLVATLAAAIQELKSEFDAYKATHP